MSILHLSNEAELNATNAVGEADALQHAKEWAARVSVRFATAFARVFKEHRPNGELQVPWLTLYLANGLDHFELPSTELEQVEVASRLQEILKQEGYGDVVDTLGLVRLALKETTALQELINRP